MKKVYQWVVHDEQKGAIWTTQYFYETEKEAREAEYNVTSQCLVYRARWTELEIQG